MRYAKLIERFEPTKLNNLSTQVPTWNYVYEGNSLTLVVGLLDAMEYRKFYGCMLIRSKPNSHEPFRCRGLAVAYKSGETSLNLIARLQTT